MNDESYNESRINQLGRDMDYYKRCLKTDDHFNAGLTGKSTASYKKTIKRLENEQQLAILKERNIRS